MEGGRPFDKATPYQLLTNPIYTGKRRYKDELHNGEHDPIIDQDLFDKFHHQLKENGRTGGVEVRNKYVARLRGLLRCKCCGTAMTHTFCGKNKRNFYRYYRCINAIKNVHDIYPAGTLPAGEIERVVIDEVLGLAKDETLLAQMLTNARTAIPFGVLEQALVLDIGRRPAEDRVLASGLQRASAAQLLGQCAPGQVRATAYSCGLRCATSFGIRRINIIE